MTKSKTPTYEDVKKELIQELQDIAFEDRNTALTYRKFVDTMVEVASSKLDRDTKRYIELGKSAEAFFGKIKVGNSND